MKNILPLLFLFFIPAFVTAQWSEVGGKNNSRFNGTISSVVSDKQSNIYCAGYFKNSNGKNYVAKWNGINWSELGNSPNFFNNTITQLLIDSSDNIYAIGNFTDSIYNQYFVAKWDGNKWNALGGFNHPAINGKIKHMVFDKNGRLYVGGDLKTNIYYTLTQNIVSSGSFVIWDGFKWNVLANEKLNIGVSGGGGFGIDEFDNIYGYNHYYNPPNFYGAYLKYNGINTVKISNQRGAKGSFWIKNDNHFRIYSQDGSSGLDFMGIGPFRIDNNKSKFDFEDKVCNDTSNCKKMPYYNKRNYGVTDDIWGNIFTYGFSDTWGTTVEVISPSYCYAYGCNYLGKNGEGKFGYQSISSGNAAKNGNFYCGGSLKNDSNFYYIAQYIENPRLTIQAKDSNICKNATYTIAAYPLFCSDSIKFDWYVNSNKTSNFGQFFSSNSLNNNDTIKCIVTTYKNGVQYIITSNEIIAHISNTTAQLSISGSNNFCLGSKAKFLAQYNSNTTNKKFIWRVNGNVIGDNSDSLVSSTITNNDIVSCLLIADSVCYATSNDILVKVQDTSKPTIGIYSDTNTICSGANATFNANVTNSVSSPIFQWQINGVNAGINSNTFSSNTFNNNDTVTCKLSTSTSTCAASANIVSNKVIMKVIHTLVPSISITCSDSVILSGANTTFTAKTIDASTNPSYIWHINNKTIITGSNTFSISTLNDNDTVFCTIFLTGINPCIAQQYNANSNKIIIKVLPLGGRNLFIYPNPATSSVTINCNNTKELIILDAM